MLVPPPFFFIEASSRRWFFLHVSVRRALKINFQDLFPPPYVSSSSPRTSPRAVETFSLFFFLLGRVLHSGGQGIFFFFFSSRSCPRPFSRHPPLFSRFLAFLRPFVNCFIDPSFFFFGLDPFFVGERDRSTDRIKRPMNHLLFFPPLSDGDNLERARLFFFFPSEYLPKCLGIRVQKPFFPPFLFHTPVKRFEGPRRPSTLLLGG